MLCREKKINELQFKIKKKLHEELSEETEIRMIRTAMARTDKNIKDQEAREQTKVQAHLDALKRTERGTAIAKNIEELERKFRKNPAKADQALGGIGVRIKQFLKRMQEPGFDFIIKERDGGRGGFDIIDNDGQITTFSIRLSKMLREQLT